MYLGNRLDLNYLTAHSMGFALYNFSSLRAHGQEFKKENDYNFSFK